MSVPSAPVVADVEDYFKSFRNILSKPQYAHFYRLVLSLLVCLQAHRVTDALRLFNYYRHWTNVYKFLRSEAWCHFGVAQELWNLAYEHMGKPLRLFAVIDDTTVRHAGAKKMAEVRQQHNASAQNDPCRAKKVWGHKWVLMGLAVMISSAHWEFMPITAALVKNGISKLALALGLFAQLDMPSKIILTVIADGWYTKHPLVTGLIRLRRIHYLGKIRRDAELYEPLSENYKRPKGKKGPKPKKGPRVYLMNLIKGKPELASSEVTIRGKKRRVDIWSRIVVIPRWEYMKARALVVRWKLKSGRMKCLCLLCTDLTLPLLEVVRNYDARWMIEPCFCDLKQKGGFASYSGRKARGHLAWAQICCVARTLLVLLNLKRKGGIIDPWRRSTQPEYTTVGQMRLELTRLLGHLAPLAQKANISGDSDTINGQSNVKEQKIAKV